jgi:hypothetical protein
MGVTLVMERGEHYSIVSTYTPNIDAAYPGNQNAPIFLFGVRHRSFNGVSSGIG